MSNGLSSVRNGRPVEPQVRKLIERFRVSRGEVYRHADIESAIKERPDSLRYRTVTNAWRKAVLRDSGILMAAVPNVGFEALSAERQLKAAIGKMKSGGRSTRRGLNIADQTPEGELSDDLRASRQLVLTSGRRLADLIRAETKVFDLRVPVTEALPRGRKM